MIVIWSTLIVLIIIGAFIDYPRCYRLNGCNYFSLCSSGDELDHIQATRQQNLRVTGSVVEKDSDDEFEQEMNNEADRLLDIAMGGSQCIEKTGSESFPDPVKHENPGDGEESTIKDETNTKYYDEIYFDSSDEERPEGRRDRVQLDIFLLPTRRHFVRQVCAQQACCKYKNNYYNRTGHIFVDHKHSMFFLTVNGKKNQFLSLQAGNKY